MPVCWLDHAATSWPKPPEVLDTLRANLGRSAPPPGLVTELAADLRELLEAPDDAATLLTHGGRPAIETLLRGALEPGDHVVTTTLDHDAVRDTLRALEARCITWSAAPLDPAEQTATPATFTRTFTRATRLAIVTHASNVTGAIQPVSAFAEICRRRGVPLLIDVAQTVGRLPVTLPDGATAVAGSLHKGLLGPRGSGFAILRPALRDWIAARQPLDHDAQRLLLDRAAVTPQLPPAVLAAAAAGLRALRNFGIERAHTHGATLAAALHARLADVPGLRVHGAATNAVRLPTAACTLGDRDSIELADWLRRRGWWVSGGDQRARMTHDALGTRTQRGVVRISAGRATTGQEIEGVVHALVTAARQARP